MAELEMKVLDTEKELICWICKNQKIMIKIVSLIVYVKITNIFKYCINYYN